MRFHGLLIVRDEADVILQSLEDMLTWVDTLHVYDLGSTDSTWDMVEDVAEHDERVFPFKSEPTVYSDSIRCFLFDRLRAGFDEGDWIIKLDADEFYPTPPPRFVRERLSAAEGMVYLQWYFFRLTTEEAADYGSGKVSIAADRLKSIRDRRRYYKVSQWSEPRMFRYRRSMRWPATAHWPYNAGLVARERLPVLHYPHRDPVQMARRFALRAAMKRRAAKAGNHWVTSDWRGELVDARTGVTVNAQHNLRVGLTGENGIDTGALLFWHPGTDLPEVRLYGQIPAWPKRLAQRLAHAALLPFLDKRRPTFNASSRPDVLTEEENAQIGAECVEAERRFLCNIPTPEASRELGTLG